MTEIELCRVEKLAKMDELDATRDLFTCSNEPSKDSNLGSPVEMGITEKNSGSLQMIPKSDQANSKSDLISGIDESGKKSRNSSPSSSQLKWGVSDASDSITPTQRREREAKASQHPCFNPMILCPLSNLGNMCYFNAGIQILSNCPAFVFGLRDAPHFYLLAQEKLRILNRYSTPANHKLFQLLSGLLYKMEYTVLDGVASISPSNAIDQLAEVFYTFEGRRQQDCPEMINAVLMTIEDENRLELEVSEMLHSFEAAAQAYKQERFLSASNDLSIATHKVDNVSDPFLCSELSQSSTTHTLPNQKKTSPSRSCKHLPGSRSAHTMSMLHLMQRVNDENAELERKAREREGKPYNQNSFYSPRLVYNPTTQGFKGYIVSEIRCHNCSSISRVVNSFSSLILDIPSERHRQEFAKRHPNINRFDASGKPLHSKKRPAVKWWNPFSHFYYFYRDLYNRLFSCLGIVNYPLTLKECLDIHFDPIELKGSNKYQCQSCGGLHEATKSEFLLSLPEYLFIHMKRFRMNTFMKGKNLDPVIFPVSWTSLRKNAQWEELLCFQTEILDLRGYMHPEVAVGLEPIPSDFHNPDAAQDESVEAFSFVQQERVPSTYTLEGIVNHHGSITSGHYTVFAHKKINNKDMWLHINDEEISSVSLECVADSEEYLLLYHLQPILEPTEEFLRLRDKARYYLFNSRIALQGSEDEKVKTKIDCNAPHCQQDFRNANSQSRKGGVVYISSMWLQCAAFFQNPGPILNKICYASEKRRGEIAKQLNLLTSGTQIPETLLEVYGPPVEWYYAEIDEVDYRAFYEAYGGDGPVTRTEYEVLKENQQTLVNFIWNKMR